MTTFESGMGDVEASTRPVQMKGKSMKSASKGMKMSGSKKNPFSKKSSSSGSRKMKTPLD